MKCKKHHIEVIAGYDASLCQSYIMVCCSNPDCQEVIEESEDGFCVIDLEVIKEAARKHLKKRGGK